MSYTIMQGSFLIALKLVPGISAVYNETVITIGAMQMFFLPDIKKSALPISVFKIFLIAPLVVVDFLAFGKINHMYLLIYYSALGAGYFIRYFIAEKRIFILMNVVLSTESFARQTFWLISMFLATTNFGYAVWIITAIFDIIFNIALSFIKYDTFIGGVKIEQEKPVELASVLAINSEVSVSLTEREIEVLLFLAEGLSSKEIADELSVSKRTIDFHRGNLKRKLNAGTPAELVKYAVENREKLAPVINTSMEMS
jgi:DNA-binding CsgD family transcriptional regulator